LEEAEVARRAGADLITFGPVFESPGKGTPVGLGELKRVCEAMGEFPIAALGGIDAGNAQKAIDAGASGIAAIRLLNRAVLETGSDDAAACFNISV
jgi:thiamine-phosphate pyrophosphorylase